MTKERVLPHSLEAERAVLGSILVSDKAWPVAASCVVASDFFREAHRDIFAALNAMAERGVAPDYITLKDELQRAGKLEDIGGPAYISGLTDGIPKTSNVEHYASIVREKARMRRLIAEAERLRESAYSEEQTAAELIDGSVGRLIESVRLGGTDTPITADQAVRDYSTALLEGNTGQPTLTGFADVDALTGGFRPADFVIIAARPSVGKSSFGLAIAKNAAQPDKVSLFFTLEMSIQNLSERLLAWESGVSATSVLRGTATEDEYQRLAAAISEFNNGALLLQATAHTVTEIGGWCRRIQQEYTLGSVYVDYLQLVSSDINVDSKEAEIAAISRSFKRLAKELNVPMVIISQLNRAPEARQDKRPHPADLRGSGALEQDCDLLLLIHRPEMYKATDDNAGIAEVIVAKHRNGPTGVVRLYFNKDLARFDNLSYR